MINQNIQECIMDCLKQYPVIISLLIFEYASSNLIDAIDSILTGYYEKDITCITVLPDGRITGGLKAVRSGTKTQMDCSLSFDEHTDSITSIVSFKNTIISGSKDNSIKTWQIPVRDMSPRYILMTIF